MFAQTIHKHARFVCNDRLVFFFFSEMHFSRRALQRTPRNGVCGVCVGGSWEEGAGFRVQGLGFMVKNTIIGFLSIPDYGPYYRHGVFVCLYSSYFEHFPYHMKLTRTNTCCGGNTTVFIDEKENHSYETVVSRN